ERRSEQEGKELAHYGASHRTEPRLLPDDQYHRPAGAADVLSARKQGRGYCEPDHRETAGRHAGGKLRVATGRVGQTAPAAHARDAGAGVGRHATTRADRVPFPRGPYGDGL